MDPSHYCATYPVIAEFTADQMLHGFYNYCWLLRLGLFVTSGVGGRGAEEKRSFG